MRRIDEEKGRRHENINRICAKVKKIGKKKESTLILLINATNIFQSCSQNRKLNDQMMIGI
jgi:hypothetical protein